MVFTSIPAYLDPSTFHQQENCQVMRRDFSNTSLISPAQPAPAQPHGTGIRPGSMVERARMANIQMPETALKCPRCESTNTKFCYFNNYSLSQPRHFCKACRRYWTSGGALRNVPVGGGCRRNKRSKPSSSKSLASTNTTSKTTGGSAAVFTGVNPPVRFMSPFSELTDTFTGDMGLSSYNGINSPVFHAPSIFSVDGGSAIGNEPWRLPFFGGVESSPPGMFQFHGGESSIIEKAPSTSTPVKMEKSFSRLIPTAGFHGTGQWNPTPATWNDFSGFSASSTTNPL